MPLIYPNINKTQEPNLLRSKKGTLLVEGNLLNDKNLRIINASKNIFNITNYDVEELLGSPFSLIYDNSYLKDLIKKLPIIAQTSDFFWMDRPLIQNGGNKVLAKWTIQYNHKNRKNSDQFIITIKILNKRNKTITSQKNVNQKNSNELSEQIALTAGGVAHDFKNALHIIKSNIQLIKDSLPFNADKELFSYLRDSNYAIEDAEDLAKQMLDFTTKKKTVNKTFNIVSLLERSSYLCTAGTQVTCRIQVNPNTKLIKGNSSQIYQVFYNLIMNSCQAMDYSGVINIKVFNFKAEEHHHNKILPGQYTAISIKDKGCGISSENLTKIFREKFTTKKNGNGVGLASSKSIVENHGGKICIASKVGIGTEFLVLLPSEKPKIEKNYEFYTHRSKNEKLNLDQTKIKKIENANVLIVEDQPMVARATSRLLEKLGHRCIFATNGQEAIKIYKDVQDSIQPIDLVLMDMTLPGGLDGKDTLLEIKKLDPFAKSISTSGYFENNSFKSVSDFGFNDFLPKPYSIELLSNKINKVLSDK